MSEIDSITVNDEKYVKERALQSSSKIKIVVLQRGWVLVGRFEQDGTNCKLHDASVIRMWGTTKGLGELAMSGPLSGTKLDKCHGLVEFDILTVVLQLSVNESIWQKDL